MVHKPLHGRLLSSDGFSYEGRTASGACTVGPLWTDASSWRITGWTGDEWSSRLPAEWSDCLGKEFLA